MDGEKGMELSETGGRRWPHCARGPPGADTGGRLDGKTVMGAHGGTLHLA